MSAWAAMAGSALLGGLRGHQQAQAQARQNEKQARLDKVTAQYGTPFLGISPSGKVGEEVDAFGETAGGAAAGGFAGANIWQSLASGAASEALNKKKLAFLEAEMAKSGRSGPMSADDVNTDAYMDQFTQKSKLMGI